MTRRCYFSKIDLLKNCCQGLPVSLHWSAEVVSPFICAALPLLTIDSLMWLHNCKTSMCTLQEVPYLGSDLSFTSLAQVLIDQHQCVSPVSGTWCPSPTNLYAGIHHLHVTLVVVCVTVLLLLLMVMCTHITEGKSLHRSQWHSHEHGSGLAMTWN